MKLFADTDRVQWCRSKVLTIRTIKVCEQGDVVHVHDRSSVQMHKIIDSSVIEVTKRKPLCQPSAVRSANEKRVVTHNISSMLQLLGPAAHLIKVN